MKQIIKRSVFLLAIILLCQCEKENNIVNIPDDNFLKALVEEGVDTDGDGLISLNEAAAVSSLGFSGDISSLKGIEKFVYLETLTCLSNSLTELDLQKNSSLKELTCYCSHLMTLNVSNCPELINLRCNNNHLTFLDLSKNSKLKELRCGYTLITSIDLSHNTELEFLVISYNHLSSLDISSNSSLNYIDLMGMDHLFDVRVWEVPCPPDGVLIDTEGSPNIYFTVD